MLGLGLGLNITKDLVTLFKDDVIKYLISEDNKFITTESGKRIIL